MTSRSASRGARGRTRSRAARVFATIGIAFAPACTSQDGPPAGAPAPPADAGGAFDAGPPGDAGPFQRTPDLATMVPIPAGTFSMGHPVEKPGAYGQPWKENELPAHDVTLSAFRIDRDEVTVAAYADFLNAAGGDAHRHPLMAIERQGDAWAPRPGAAALPIALVSWFDAATYCAWAGKRLPTEAEWERAARGPKGATHPWGEQAPSCDRAVFFTGSAPCADAPRPVGERSPKGDSAEGVRDLAGNVAEWVADFYDRYEEAASTDPKGPATGAYRVVRGGGFHESGASLRGTARWPAGPGGRSPGVGFRCAF